MWNLYSPKRISIWYLRICVIELLLLVSLKSVPDDLNDWWNITLTASSQIFTRIAFDFAES
jgi:hypothetical protein